MMKYVCQFITLLIIVFLFISCDKKQDSIQLNEPKLIIKLAVDENQERLGNNGLPESIPSNHAAQNPKFNNISGHYLELAPDANTFLGDGEIVYKGEETNAGGENAIDFNQSVVVSPGETWLEIPLKNIKPDTYEWVRLSLSYQNYDIIAYYNDFELEATLVSFLGFRQYIKNYTIGDETVSVNANKDQGYWGFKTPYNTLTGQAPAGATTVPNPLFDSSPIPQGSCVVTGEFTTPLTITGNETDDITLTLSLSVNQSFEWIDTNNNGRWDVGPNANENLVDMGVRGLVPSYR